MTAREAQVEELPWGPHEWLARAGLTDSKLLQLVRVTMPAGKAHRFHRHPAMEELLYVVAGRIEIVTMYNAVTHEFLVNTKHDGDLIGSRTVREPEELERAMTELVSFPAFTIASGSARDRYLVRVRVELGPGAALGIFPYQRTTPWRESNKVRLGPPEP